MLLLHDSATIYAQLVINHLCLSAFKSYQTADQQLKKLKKLTARSITITSSFLITAYCSGDALG